MSVTKEDLEKQRIALEIANLARPFYKAPTFWISLATALVAVFGVVGQSFVSKVDRAQAQVDRDRALLAKEKAEKDLSEIETRRADKQKQVEGLESRVNVLQIEARNQEEKLRTLVAVAAATPSSARAPQLAAAAEAASKSLFSIAVYSLNVKQEQVDALADAMRRTGYTLLKAEALPARTPWLSPKTAVLYYDDKSKPEALRVAELVKGQTGLPAAVEKGAGAGIPQGKEATSLRIHLVQPQ